MPTRCVAGSCSNTPDLENGIALHSILHFSDDRPQVKKRRKKWEDFVKQKRAKWEPSKNSAICSVHFKPEDFQRLFASLPGQSTAYIPCLNRDDFEVATFPTIHAVGKWSNHHSQSTTRERWDDSTPYFTVNFFVNLKHRLKIRVCIYFVFPSQTDNTGDNTSSITG